MAIFVLGVISINAQGSHLPFIIFASIASGVVAGGLAFGKFRARRVAAAQ